MATIIRSPKVGEQPRRVVQGSKTDHQGAQKKIGVYDAYGDSGLNSPTPPTSVSGQSPTVEHDASDIQLQSNPLAEALKLANARTAEVEQRMESLEADIEQRRKSAYENGYQEGRTKGIEDGLEEYRRRIGILDELIGQFEHKIKTAMDKVEDSAIELVFAAVGKILFGELVKRDTVTQIVRNLRDRLTCDVRQLIVHVSPDDLHSLTMTKDTAEELPEGIRLVADDRIRYGGCIIEADSGNLDARLEVQLKELLELFTKVRQQGKEECS